MLTFRHNANEFTNAGLRREAKFMMHRFQVAVEERRLYRI